MTTFSMHVLTWSWIEMMKGIQEGTEGGRKERKESTERPTATGRPMVFLSNLMNAVVMAAL